MRDPTIIGVDCATDPTKVGIARAELRDGEWMLTHAEIGGSQERLVGQVAGWVTAARDTLLALDAPLGWPRPLGESLAAHRAGVCLGARPDEMFRRETDRFARRRIGKQPLDIGADRIARTAHAALALLEQVRGRTRQAIPLAWTPAVEDVATIEVYPAATLRQHRLPDSKYKQPDQSTQRHDIVEGLAAKLRIPESVRPRLEHNADVLDAAVCVLAAVDFLSGRALAPDNLELAKQEGWIWIAAG